MWKQILPLGGAVRSAACFDAFAPPKSASEFSGRRGEQHKVQQQQNAHWTVEKGENVQVTWNMQKLFKTRIKLISKKNNLP